MDTLYDDEPNVLSLMGGKIKFTILKKLEENPKGLCLKDFREELGINTDAKIRYHVKKLMNALMVKHNEDNYVITNYGKMILKEIATIEFLEAHKTFFKNHMLNDPMMPKFRPIENNVISKSKIITADTLVSEHIWSKIIRDAKEHVYSKTGNFIAKYPRNWRKIHAT